MSERMKALEELAHLAMHGGCSNGEWSEDEQRLIECPDISDRRDRWCLHCQARAALARPDTEGEQDA